MWLGRIICTLLGYSALGIIGAIIGFFIGGIFDRGLSGADSLGTVGGGAFKGFGFGPSAEQLEQLQRVFFTTVFALMGHLAKADGRVSEEEVAHTEQFMGQMGLTPDHRREAIALFKAGSNAAFSLEDTLDEFMRVCGSHINLRQMVLVYLVGVALADGTLDPAEERMLRRVAERLGYSAADFEQLMSMIRGQDHFSRQQWGGGAATASASDIEAAYQALGVSSDASDKELKRAYRRLMSQYHPDKLMGEGVPEDMLKMATERSQEIQAAYDLIKKQRKAA